MSNVSRWLENIGLSQYADAFAAHEIEWSLIPDLNHEYLTQIGVSIVGHRMRILNAVAELTKQSSDAVVPSVDTAERRQLTVMFCDLVGSTDLWRAHCAAFG